MRNRGDLTRASMLCCTLFVAEDPGIIAARRALGDVWSGTAAGIIVDVALGITMTAYNFAASRYVVSVSQAASIDMAIRRLEEMRIADLAREHRRGRRLFKLLLRRINPFAAIKSIAERFGKMVDSLRTRADRRALARVAEVMGELAAVNVLGVPGAGLESVARSEAVTTSTSFRHASLFVVSWFVGARLLDIVLGSLYDIPGAGQVIAAATGFVGVAFDMLTNVQHPIGLAMIALVAAGLIRYTRAVERVAATIR